MPQINTHTVQYVIETFDPSLSIGRGSLLLLAREVEGAVRSVKGGNEAGVDNILEELVQAGAKVMIDTLYAIFRKIRETGEWPTK